MNKLCDKRGFTLIELMVSMFILVMVMGAMVAVSVSIFQSYQKSKAIKTVTEDVGFALNSIAKDVRMGKIEYSVSSCVGNGALPEKCLMLTRNDTGKKICYKIVGSSLIQLVEETNDCIIGKTYKTIVDLSKSNMTFDDKTGFYSCPSARSATDPGYSACSPAAMRRGWAEINLNIENPSMSTDSIHVQTTVSSRDYGAD